LLSRAAAGWLLPIDDKQKKGENRDIGLLNCGPLMRDGARALVVCAETLTLFFLFLPVQVLYSLMASKRVLEDLIVAVSVLK
jgi:hypothetical protein